MKTRKVADFLRERQESYQDQPGNFATNAHSILLGAVGEDAVLSEGEEMVVGVALTGLFQATQKKEGMPGRFYLDIIQIATYIKLCQKA